MWRGYEFVCVHVCMFPGIKALVLFDEIVRATQLRTISLLLHLEKQTAGEGRGIESHKKGLHNLQTHNGDFTI